MEGNLERTVKRYGTVQNAGLVIGGLIVLGWIWGTVQTLQKNFSYQQQVDVLAQSIELDKLRNETLRYQQAYLKSDEFLELSAREKLGKASPGENLVILPDSREIKDAVKLEEDAAPSQQAATTNVDLWVRFFFGG